MSIFRIKNISLNTSKRGLVNSLIWNFVFYFIILALYFSSTTEAYSFASFWNWYKFLFHYLASMHSTRQPFGYFYLLVLLPISLLIWLVCEIYSLNSNRNYCSGGHIKYIEFKNRGINFYFANPKYDFVCDYNNVASLEMIIYTNISSFTMKPSMHVNQVNLKFTLNDKRTYTVSSTPVFAMPFIYKVIDYSRRLKNFSYRYKGCGEFLELTSKIDYYLKFNCKTIFSKNSVLYFKLFSIILFLSGCFMLFVLSGFVEAAFKACRYGFIAIVCSPLILSFIVDVILLYDEIKKKSCTGGYNE